METNILTTTLTNETSPELLRNEIDSRIVKIRPSSTPLDQISRLGSARRAGSMRVEYYSVDTKEGSAALDETVRSLSLEPGKPFTLKVNNGAIFSETETVLIPDITVNAGNYNGQALVCYVTAVSSDSITLIPVNIAGTTAPIEAGELKMGARIVRMGRAARELDVQTSQFIVLPRKDYNYCQIFKSQVEESLYQRLADKEVGWQFTDQEEVAIMDMRLGMEKSFLFGARSRIELAGTGDEVFLTGGIWNQTDKTFNYEKGQLTANSLVQLCSRVFTGQNGSPVKVLFAGSGLVDALSSLDYTKTISAERTVAKWGLELREIRSTYGAIYLVHSEVFDQCGRANDGMVVDPNYITKYVHTPFTVEKLDLRQSGQRNTDAVVLTEISCLVLRYPNAHCRIICDE